MAAVQGRDGQHIHHRQVHGQKCHKVGDVLQSLGRVGGVLPHLTDHHHHAHRAGHILDPRAAALLREQKELTPVVETYRSYKAAREDLETARELAVPGDGEEMLDFFLSLEILTPQWEAMLRCPSPGPWDARTPALARYLLRRYTLQAVSDYDLYSRVKLAVIACLLVKSLGGDFLRTAQLFSKEIENDADNVDAILDAAYSHPAFTDAKLLGMLLAGS